MWPWGHLAVGYLCYVGLLRLRRHSEGRQTLSTLLAVAVGSQFPDLIDKPLGWTVSVLPSARSLAHSLITATVVIAVVYHVSQRYRREDVATAFGIGYVSHNLADIGPTAISGLLRGETSHLADITYLLWPLLPAPPPVDRSLVPYLLSVELTPYVTFQFMLLALAIVVWISSGTPGLKTLHMHVLRWVTTDSHSTE